MSENIPVNERPERRTRLTASSQGAMWVGIGLIALGVNFLLQQAGIDLHLWFFNWWSLFLIVPGAILLKKVYDGYQANGEQMNRDLRNRLVIGGALVLVGFSMAFELSGAFFWPVALILIGGALLFRQANRA
jgi:cation transport ATPase